MKRVHHLTTLAALALTALLAVNCATKAMPTAPLTLTVSVQAPDLAWRIHIDEVHRVGDELWVVSILDRPPVMAGQMITTIKDTVTVEAPPLPARHFVLGKTWNWENPEPHTFLRSRKEIEQRLAAGTRIYKRTEAPR